MKKRLKKGKFDFDEKTSVPLMRRRLTEAREIGAVYLIARVVECIKARGEKAELRPGETRQLVEAIEQARFGKNTPLKEWLPRGYQIVRLIATAKAVIPGFEPKVTKKDIELAKEALAQFKREGDDWDPDQIPSLLYSAKNIGIELE